MVKSLRALLTAFVIAMSIIGGLRTGAAETPTVAEPGVASAPLAKDALQAPTSQPLQSQLAGVGTFAEANVTVAGASQFAVQPQESDWPRWYVSADSLFLWRDNHYSWTTAGDFDVGVGPRIALGVRPNADWEVEGVYFGVFGMDAGFKDFRYDSFSFPFSNDEYIDTEQHEYRSQLQNAELNVLHSWNRLSLLAGFRYLRLGEEYSDTYHSQAVGSSYFYLDRTTAKTSNNLFGGQLGARWRDEYHALFWEATGKAGVFGNQSNTDYFDESAAPEYNVSRMGRNQLVSDVAFVGELNFNLGLHLYKCWSIRGGYNLLWIDGVAMPPDRVAYWQPKPPNNGHDVFLHGASVGLEATW